VTTISRRSAKAHSARICLGHVTGASTYFNDHQLQGMLHLKVLRSPHAHARIRHIDTAEAERSFRGAPA